MLVTLSSAFAFPGIPAPSEKEKRWDFALVTAEGEVRVALRAEATHGSEYVRSVLAQQNDAGELLVAEAQAEGLEPDPARPPRSGLRFYRAEPVPAHWASKDWPDNYYGGRWGPPYALLQGSFMPDNAHLKPGAADHTAPARPVIQRGMLAWAAGQGGPDFFIALAQHPEWGNGHTVFAEVLPEDMAIVDAIMRRPLRVANWGSINATELVTPLPFKLRRVLGPVGGGDTG